MKPPRSVLLLSLLFATLYFVQGFAEPTEGLIAQPVRAELRHMRVPTDIASNYTFLIGLPWSFKMLFGLVSDFAPICGSRRKSYLALSTLCTAVCCLIAAAIPFELSRLNAIFWIIFVASLGVAFTDVVVDSLAVTTGQKYGLTGRFQAVQWGSIYLAAIMTGALGGSLSQNRLTWIGFMICGILAMVSLVMTLLVVSEPPKARENVSPLQAIGTTLRSPLVWTVGGFLFLWNFNPFSSVVQEEYMTSVLRLTEQNVGDSRSASAVGSVLACAIYAIIGPRISIRQLIHGSIVVGIISSLVFLLMRDLRSALIVSFASGALHMFGTLVQLDLAARACHVDMAGTTFAGLMALSNTGSSIGNWFGGQWYEWLGNQQGHVHAAYSFLVLLGGLFTAASWLLVPAMTWARQFEKSETPASF